MANIIRSSPLTLPIQPPLLATPHHPLFPPPTALFIISPTSPFSPHNSNFVGIACAVPAGASQPSNEITDEQVSEAAASVFHVAPTQARSVRVDDTGADVMSGTLAGSGTPLQDGTGVAFVFRSLRINTVGEWRVKIVVMQMNTESGEAKCCGEVLSTVVRVQEEDEGGESERLGNLCKYSLSSLLFWVMTFPPYEKM